MQILRRFPKEPPATVSPSVYARTEPIQDGFARNITGYFIQKMASLGFGQITAMEIDNAVWATKKWPQGKKTCVLNDNEVLFNLGLKNGRSNFFVYMKNNQDGSIEIFYTNPRSDEVGLTLTKDELYRHHVIRKGTKLAERIVDKIVEEIEYLGRAKFPEDLRMQTHHHSAYLFEKGNGYRIFDDGESNIRDVIRKLALYHTDVWNFSPHNSFDLRMHRILDAVSGQLGITYVPGTELTGTMPTPGEDKGKNGPHIVLGFTLDAGDEIKRRILSKRIPMEMHSYFMGMELPAMDKVLQELRKRGMLFTIAAHPVNRNTPGLPIKMVGAISAVDLGVWTLDDATAFLRRCDAIAAWNQTLDDSEMNIKNFELQGWLYEKISKHKCGERLAANPSALAVASWANRTFGTGTIYESDEHITPAMDEYVTGGDGFAKGFTRIMLKKELFEMLKREHRNPTAEEIVKWVVKKQAVLRAKIFCENDGKTLRIVKARTDKPDYTWEERIMLTIRHGWHYAVALIKDAWRFLKQGEFKHLFHPDK